MSLNLGNLGLKSRSLGQSKEDLVGFYRGYISCSIDLKIGWYVYFDKISDEFKFGSLGQIKEIICGHSRGHIFCSFVLKLGQIFCLDEISDEFEFGSPGVKN